MELAGFEEPHEDDANRYIMEDIHVIRPRFISTKALSSEKNFGVCGERVKGQTMTTYPFVSNDAPSFPRRVFPQPVRARVTS
jgi:hypothetical protein